MRVGPSGEIILSERNLLALLHKLRKPGSHRTIVKAGVGTVRAELDDEHYRLTDEPTPGPMTADTEQFIAERQT